MNIELLESRIAPALIFAVDDANNLLTFDSTSPMPTRVRRCESDGTPC